MSMCTAPAAFSTSGAEATTGRLGGAPGGLPGIVLGQQDDQTRRHERQTPRLFGRSRWSSAETPWQHPPLPCTNWPEAMTVTRPRSKISVLSKSTGSRICDVYCYPKVMGWVRPGFAGPRCYYSTGLSARWDKNPSQLELVVSLKPRVDGSRLEEGTKRTVPMKRPAVAGRPFVLGSSQAAAQRSGPPCFSEPFPSC